MKIKIKKFDATTIKKDAVVLLIGKRGSGKTTLMKDIMFNMKDKLDFGIAMSPTEETTASLGSFLPPSCIYNTFSSTALDTMLESELEIRVALHGAGLRRWQWNPAPTWLRWQVAIHRSHVVLK